MEGVLRIEKKSSRGLLGSDTV